MKITPVSILRSRKGGSLATAGILVGVVSVSALAGIALIGDGQERGFRTAACVIGLVADSECVPAPDGGAGNPPGGGAEDPPGTSVPPGGSTGPTEPPPPVSAPPVITATELPIGVVGANYSVRLSAVDPENDPLTWRVASGVLPVGVSLASDGILSGNPAEEGVFSFVVEVSDGTGNLVTADRQIIVEGHFIAGVSSLEVGSGSVCAIKTDGTVWCWGGPSTAIPASRRSDGLPVQALTSAGTPLTGVVQTSSIGEFWITRRADGTLWSWGKNNYGQTGVSGSTLVPRATMMPGTLRWIDVSAGAEHACGVATTGRIYCWGNDGANGAIGYGSYIQTSTPKAIGNSSMTGFIKVSAGYSYACALRNDGTVWCWGGGWNGNLGNGRTSNSASPVQVRTSASTMLSDVVDIAAGRGSACALRADDSVWCWGKSISGIPGAASQYAFATRAGVLSGLNAAELDGGGYHMCLRTRTGQARCWGSNSYGELGQTGSFLGSAPIYMNADVRMMSSGPYVSCAVKDDTSAWCSGYNYYGQVGDGATANVFAPKQVRRAP